MRSLRTTNRRARRKPWFPRHVEFVQFGGCAPVTLELVDALVLPDGWTGLRKETA